MAYILSAILNLSRKYKTLFYVLLFAGLLTRLLWVMLADTLPMSDFLLYHESALSIVNGQGYKIYGYLSAYEPIGYPAFLAVLYYVFAPEIIVPKIANILLSCLTIVLTYVIAKRAFSEKTALIAVFIMVIIPRNITFTSVLSTEITFTALFTALNLLVFLRPEGIWAIALRGVLTAVLALIKPYMLVYQFVIFAIDYFHTRKPIPSLKTLLLTTAVMIVLISPWTIRNYIIFNTVIPISTNGGYNLFINNNSYATGGWQDPFKIPGSPLLKHKHDHDEFWDEVEVDRLGKMLAFQWIKSNPGDFVRLGFVKMHRTFIMCNDVEWAIYELDEGKEFKHTKLLNNTAKTVHYVLLTLIAFYFIFLLRYIAKKRTMAYMHLIILLNIAFYAAVVFVFEGQPRYSFPLVPLYAIMASWVFTNRILSFFR